MTKKVPDKLFEQIGGRIELRCNGASGYQSADPLNPIVSVRSKLMDDKVFVTKKGDEK